MKIDKNNQWEDLKNIKQKNKNLKHKDDGIKNIIGKIKKKSIRKIKNDTGKIKKKRGGRNRLNLTGQKFGRWTVLEFARVNNQKTIWKCKCECGKIKDVIGISLKNGYSKSCGCIAKEATSKLRRSNLIGCKFTRLMILEDVGNNKWGASLWRCQCECGNEKIVSQMALKNGDTKSCGCLNMEKHRGKEGESGFNLLLKSYKNGAKIRNLEFNLTKEEFENIVKQNCFYCGIEPRQLKTSRKENKWGAYIYNGIDRKNNNEGYIIENCVSCCKICNKAKDTMTIEEFKKWAKMLFNYQFNNKI